MHEPTPRPWFRVGDGLYFRRATDAGGVEIGHGPDFDHVEVLQLIDASSWASVLATCSRTGADTRTHAEALGYHQRDAATAGATRWEA